MVTLLTGRSLPMYRVDVRLYVPGWITSVWLDWRFRTASWRPATVLTQTALGPGLGGGPSEGARSGALRARRDSRASIANRLRLGCLKLSILVRGIPPVGRPTRPLPRDRRRRAGSSYCAGDG